MKRKTDIVLLAAGNSSRFGIKNKMYYKVNGESMLLHAVNTALQIKNDLPEIIDQTILVSTEKNVDTLSEEIKKQVSILFNQHSESGISSSIRLGVMASDHAKNLLFMVCDQPWLRSETVEEMVCGFYRAVEEDGAEYGCLYSEYTGMANPCIFLYSKQEKLLALTGDKGGKQLLIQNVKKVYCHTVKDDKELQDIDELPW